MTHFKRDDPEFVQEQYKSQDNLSVRIRTHQLYSEQQINFPAWALDQIPWRGNERVLDVGCGAGVYVAEAMSRCRHYIAGDLSLGMLAELSEPIPDRLNLNAEALPFGANSFDVILANHMIYHVPDKKRACAEFRRALRLNGILLAATNSAHSMREFSELASQAFVQLTGKRSPDPMSYNRLPFTLEDGAQILGSAFAQVRRIDKTNAFVFPTPQPVIDYLGSAKERWESLLANAGISWEQVETALTSLLSDHIAVHGEFRVNTLTGVFVCQ